MSSIQTEWDLSLIYDSPEDPQIKKDMQKIKKLYSDFAKKYRDRDDYLNDAGKLKTALEDYEAISKEINTSKPIIYFQYILALNSDDQHAESMSNKLQQELTQIGNQVLFFTLRIGTISKEKQQAFLEDERLEYFRYFLERLFLEAEYNLTEAQEELLNLTYLPRHGMWVNGVQKSLNKRMVSFEGEKIPLSEAREKIQELPTEKRRQLYRAILEEVQQVSDFAESEINAVVTDKKIRDSIRGHEKPYSATILGYENKEEMVLNLAETVTDNFDISHDFYDLKAELLEIKTLTYADRQAKIGDVSKEIPFEESVNILRDAFGNTADEFGDILNRFLRNGQIDVFPKEGKSGGAFCSGTSHLPTYVLLNYTPGFRAVKIFAHEMGHAIHSELSKEQPIFYENYSTSVAEVASTFFEEVVFDALFESFSEEEKVIALHNRINDDIATVFRQIALFNFEVDLHNTIREKGSMSKKEMAELLNTHMKAYLGPRFDLKEEDGYAFIVWPHIRYFFYVYSYAYGHLISRALYNKYKADTTYIEQVKTFLRAGGSQSPYDIFNDIGIDTEKPAVFKEGLQTIRDDITKLRKLTG